MSGRILLADDEETFLLSTADLLRREGYLVDAVEGSQAAMEALARQPYDLLIADIRMAGNGSLEMLASAKARDANLPVVIVTGYPSVETALGALDLRVEGYLIKPFEFPRLREMARAAIHRSRILRTVQAAEQRLAGWREEISSVAIAEREAPGRAHSATTQAFVDLTLRNIMGSLSDLESVAQAAYSQHPRRHVCEIFNCPRAALLEDAIQDAIDVLEETRTSFKSKELGALRKRLEDALRANQQL